MEKYGKIRLINGCFTVHFCGLYLGEVRIQFDLISGVEDILGHGRFVDLDYGDFYLDYGKDDLDEA